MNKKYIFVVMLVLVLAFVSCDDGVMGSGGGTQGGGTPVGSNRFTSDFYGTWVKPNPDGSPYNSIPETDEITIVRVSTRDEVSFNHTVAYDYYLVIRYFEGNAFRLGNSDYVAAPTITFTAVIGSDGKLVISEMSPSVYGYAFNGTYTKR